MLDVDASNFQTISVCQDGLACRRRVHNKSCMSQSWNLENDMRTILVTSYEDIGHVRKDATRKLL